MEAGYRTERSSKVTEGSDQGEIDLGQLAAEIRKKHGKGTDDELDQGDNPPPGPKQTTYDSQDACQQ